MQRPIFQLADRDWEGGEEEETTCERESVIDYARD